jgi:PTH1 family peptidyl-tRNA hydrolase
MYLLVGLGNPGKEYEDTRHNVGFWVIDALAERAGVRGFDKKFKAELARATIGGAECLLMKPQTFMNLSGESVGPALGFYKLTTSDVVVFHDELDVELGRLKLKKGGGHGGHNGLRSLMQHLPDDGFTRVRLGIGRPPPRWDVADYVLNRFGAGERPLAEKMVEEATEAAEAIIRSGLSRAMALYNRNPTAPDGPNKGKAKPPRSGGES